MKVSIIIPVYNEGHCLRELLERVLAAALPAGCTKEVIVVDDGSTDGTAPIVEEYAGRGMVINCRSCLNGGKGLAIRRGLVLASGEVILIQDGDLEYDPNEYMRMLTPLTDGQADVVYGSRFRGRPSGMSFKNLIANKILTFTANRLYGASITDEGTGYKAFRTPVLKQLSFECKRFDFCPEVTAKLSRLGLRIHEVPISYRARRIAEGKKIRARDGAWAVWTLLKCRFLPRERLSAKWS